MLYKPCFRFSVGGKNGERSSIIDGLSSLFYIEHGNVLTKENLKKIQKIQQQMFDVPEYQESYCHIEDGSCSVPLSIIRFFDGTYIHIDTRFDDPEFDDIIRILYLADNNNETKEELQNYLGSNSKISSVEAESDITRVTLPLGYPLKNFKDTDDRKEKQGDLVKDFCLDFWEPIATKYFEDGVGDMDYYFSSLYMIVAVISKQALLDLALAIGSCIFIFLFMWFQTGSVWVTGWSLFSIITAFCTTALIYR